MSLPGPSPDAEIFRAALGRFPTGVTVVSTVHEGMPHAMTASSFTSVSLEPLLVLVCVARATRFHPAVLAAGCWGVSMLAAHQVELSRRFATHDRDLDESLDGVSHRAGRWTGVPLLDGALATLECRTTATHDGGDHSIVVGEVLAIEVGDDLSPALVWHRGQYGRLAPAKDQPTS
ncbi:MAG TPA: flavin reductase family protein [Mycobacteriales bacterium]|nr:flavin reductase family protein [Mycobacteriales bacterium]